MLETLPAVASYVKPVYYLVKGAMFICKNSTNYLERDYYTFKILKDLKLIKLKKDFGSIYCHTMYEISKRKETGIVKLFTLKEVIEGFKVQFYEKQNWAFETELVSNLHTNKEVRQLKNVQVDITKEITEFTTEFKRQIQLSRNPGEIDHINLSNDTNEKITAVNEKLEKVHTFVNEGFSVLLKERDLKDLEYSKDLINNDNPSQAIEYLLKFKKDKWESSVDIVKYKVLANIGICHLKLYKEKEAAKFLVEALEYNKDDSDALGYAALGYALLKDRTHFDQIYSKAISREKVSKLIYSGLIILENKRTDFEALLQKIPENIRKDGQIAYALSFFARKQGRFNDSIKWLETAIQDDKENPELKGALASSLLESVTTPHHRIISQINIGDKDKIKKAIQLLSEAWEGLKDSEVKKHRFFWLLNRGIGKKFLGDWSGAYEDIKHAAKYNSKPHTLRHSAIVSLEMNKCPEAIEILKQLKNKKVSDNEKGLAEVLLAQALIEDNQVSESIEILRDLDKDIANEKILAEASSTLIRAYVKNNDIEKALQVNQVTLKKGSERISSHLDTAFIANYQGKPKEEVLVYLNKAKACITEQTGIEELIPLGESYYKFKNYDCAIEILEKIATPEVDSMFSKMLMNSYFKAGKLNKAANICRNLREGGSIDLFVIEKEIIIYEGTDRSKAIELCENYLQKFPDEDIIRTRLAFLYYYQNNIEKTKESINKIRDIKKIHLETAFRVANLHLKVGQTLVALNLIYELRRMHYSNPDAHGHFLSILTQTGEEIVPFLKIDKVGENVAVKLENQEGKTFFYIIENRSDTSLPMDEIHVSDPIAQKLMGKTIGDEIVLKTNFGEPSTARIVQLMSKYFYARDKSMELLQNTFIEHEKLHIFSTNGDLEKFQKLLQQQLDIAQEHDKKLIEQYQKGALPIGYYASLKGVTPIEIWSGMIVDEEMGILSSPHIYNEDITAYDFLKNHIGLVIDIVGILSLSALEDLDRLKIVMPNIFVGQCTVDILRESIEYNTAPGMQERLTLFKKGNTYFRSETTREQIGRHVKQIEKILDWVERNCKILPCNEALNIEGRKKEIIYKFLGKSSAESILIAKEHNYLLYSDEGIVHALGLKEFKVSGISTQIFLQYCLLCENINKAQYDDKIVSLIAMAYKGLRIDKNILYKSLEKSGFLTARPFTSALQILYGNNSNENSAIAVSVGFLKEIYLNLPDTNTRSNVTISIIESLLVNRRIVSVIGKLELLIEKEFYLLQREKKELMEILAMWLRHKSNINL